MEDNKDYKKLYEELSRRNSQVHRLASNLIGNNDVISNTEMGRFLEKIAFGQLKSKHDHDRS